MGPLFLGLGAATRVAHVNSFLLSLADTIHDSFLDKQRGEVGGDIFLCPPVALNPPWDLDSILLTLVF